MHTETELQKKSEQSAISSIQKKLQIYQITVISSLLFALVGFSYNVWRMEVSEENNNIRAACFEMLLELSKFEQIVYTAHYDKDLIAGSPRKAWVKIGLVNDLSVLTTGSIQKETTELLSIWAENEAGLQAEGHKQVDEIVKAIDETRAELKSVLQSLE